jgi:hypothetical protein
MEIVVPNGKYRQCVAVEKSKIYAGVANGSQPSTGDGAGKRRTGIAEGHESEKQCRPESKKGRHNAYNENTLGRWLRWRNRPWHTRACQGAVLLPEAAGLRLCLPTTGRPLRLRMDLE